jgi:hypothetical protein
MLLIVYGSHEITRTRHKPHGCCQNARCVSFSEEVTNSMDKILN